MTATRDLIMQPCVQAELVAGSKMYPPDDWTSYAATGAGSASQSIANIFGTMYSGFISQDSNTARASTKLLGCAAYKAANMGAEYEITVHAQVNNPSGSATYACPGWIFQWNGNVDSPSCYAVYFDTNGTDIVVSRFNAGTETVMGTFAHGLNLSGVVSLKFRLFTGFFTEVVAVKAWTFGGTEPANTWNFYADATQALTTGRFGPAAFSKASRTATGGASIYMYSITMTDLDPLGGNGSGVTPTPTLLTSGSDATDQSTYTTANITVAAGDLLVLAVVSSAGSSGALGVASPTGGAGGAAWSALGSPANFNSATRKLSLFTAVAAADGTAAVSIPIAGTPTGCCWAVLKISGADTDTSKWSSSLAGYAAASSRTVDLSPSGPRDIDPFFCVLGFVAPSNAGGVTPSGIVTSELADVTCATPAFGLEVQWYQQSAMNGGTSVGATFSAGTAHAVGIVAIPPIVQWRQAKSTGALFRA